MELNREQIIKALECHAGNFSCDECPCDPYDGAGETYCGCIMAKNTLSLIKELTEENERLRNDRGALCSHLVCAETERTIIKADTVREFAKRLKENKVRRDGLSFKVVDFDTIDQITKEMIGEENEESL